ncbi:MAG TPA: formate--tetrahydrofolate ligase [Methanomassiliicoccales archaeon]|nr:formate--tetrahydrofolate ligase [Methanomassiliicoccales archaeon]
MKTNIEIAQEAQCLPIEKVAAKIGLANGDIQMCGTYMAKVQLRVLRRFDDRPTGKLIVTTAITPTPAGEGKTVTTIGLVEGLGSLGQSVMGCLRQPSLGPVFGVKGGATGGGLAQIYPMWDIDLHFTGDIHAVGAAHNLLSAMIENHIQRQNTLNIDPTRILWKKALDMNCRELRQIVVGLGGRGEGGVPHESGFMITAASEISAILALSTSLDDLKKRLSAMVVARTYDKKPVYAKDLGCVGAMALLLRNAIRPNLVQTLEGQPVFVHGFPFANIAHGNNSIIATRYALRMADYVVTEAGFATDLGAEKFFDIVCRGSGLRPDCAVLVASIRALKMHGGCPFEKCDVRNLVALEKGFANLDKHIANLKLFGVPVVVAVNRFPTDTVEEVHFVLTHCKKLGVRAALSTVFDEGGRGGQMLAQQVVEAIQNDKNEFHVLYDEKLPVRDKIEAIAHQVYGAKAVKFHADAEKDLKDIQAMGMDKFPVCIAKTQHSLSDDPKAKGAPTDWTLTVRDLNISAGAGFIVAVCGDIMLIPGLPSEPSALNMDVLDDGTIIGLN